MWNLNFITRENLKQHIKNTISTYEKTLDGIDLSKFNKGDFVKATDEEKKQQEICMSEVQNDHQSDTSGPCGMRGLRYPV